MTTQKLFKRRVRDRMAKTGEQYATARRHVADRRERRAAAVTEPSLTEPRPTNDSALLAAAHELASDATLVAATGRGWEGWLEILDAWGARGRKHAQTANWLRTEQGVSGWWAQTITGGYERARGMRRKHQQAHGYTVYASKTVAASVDALFEAFADEAIRRTWLADVRLAPRSSRPPKIARFDVDAGPTRVMVTFDSKGPTKATASVAHERLPDPDAAERAKLAWKARLAELKAAVEADR